MGTQGKGRKRKSSPLWWSEKRQKQRKKKIPKFLGVLWIYSNFLITSLGNSPRRVTRCPWEAPAEGQPAEEMKELPNSSRASLPSTFLSSLLTEVLLVAWQPPPRPPVMPPYGCAAVPAMRSLGRIQNTKWTGLNSEFLLHPGLSCHSTAAPSPRELWGQPQCLLSSRHEEEGWSQTFLSSSGYWENQLKMVRKSPTLRETWDCDSQQDEKGCQLATASTAEMDSEICSLPSSILRSQ